MYSKLAGRPVKETDPGMYIHRHQQMADIISSARRAMAHVEPKSIDYLGNYNNFVMAAQAHAARLKVLFDMEVELLAIAHTYQDHLDEMNEVLEE